MQTERVAGWRVRGYVTAFPMQHPGFIQDLAIVLGVAAVTGLIFQLVRQPSVLGYLLAGLIVGPYIPIPLFADPERVHQLSEFGVVLVMFAVGLEFRIGKFLEVLPVSGVTAAVEIGALFGIGTLVGSWLGWSDTASLFLGGCLCVSSTMAVSKILEQRPIAKDSRQFVFGVLVLQDVAAIALIAIMTAIAQGADASFGQVLVILGKLLLVLLAMIAGGMFIVPRLVKLIVRTGSAETLVVGSVGLCFTLALTAEHLGYSAALGAFIAGLLVAESGDGSKVEHATSSVRDLFAAVFFVSIGMTVDPAVAARHFPTALLTLLAVIVTQFVSVTLGGVLSGSGIRRSVTAGLSLGQIGEFAFIIGAIGVSARVVPEELQAVLVTVAVLSTFTTALGLRRSDAIVEWVERALPKRLSKLLALYEAWFEQIRTTPAVSGYSTGRGIRFMVLDAALIAGIAIAWRVWRGDIEGYLNEMFGLGPPFVELLSTLLLVAGLLPVLIPLLITSRTLASSLADKVFRGERSRAGATLRFAVFLLIIACVGVPLALLLGAVTGIQYVWVVLTGGLVVAVVVAVYQAREIDVDIQSGGLLMLRAIADQGLPDTAPPDRNPSSLGLTNLREVKLDDESYAVGRTLAELRLRSQTGATVIAFRPRGQSNQHPLADQPLQPSDVLLVAGCRADQLAAEELLRKGHEASTDADRVEDDVRR